MKLKFWKRKPAVEKTISEKDGESLTPWEIKSIDEAKCPDCGSGLLQGPCGGGAMNVYCANPEECDSKFNIMFPGSVDRISDRQPAKSS